MKIFIPWKKEFDRLLEAAEAQWGGKINRPKSDYSKLDVRAWPADLMLYPIYSCEIDGFKMVIEISEFSGSKAGSAADNVEFLRLIIIQGSPFAVEIRPVDIGARLKKALHIGAELECGDRTFDENFRCHAGNEPGKKLLIQGAFITQVKQLGKLSRFEISEKLIMVSYWLQDKSQLEFLYVRNLVRIMLDLARYIKSQAA